MTAPIRLDCTNVKLFVAGEEVPLAPGVVIEARPVSWWRRLWEGWRWRRHNRSATVKFTLERDPPEVTP